MCRPLLAVVALLAACGDNLASGPFDELPLDGRFEVGLLAPVHVARDRFGVAHINAATLEDAAFVQGYVMAHDRLPQMDILRRFGAGTLSELFGALDPSVIDTDLEMRMHRMRPLAEQTWAQLRASSDPIDQEIVVLLQRFADGVNAYATQLRSDANPEGIWELDPDVLVSFDPQRFVPWTPEDSLVLGRFQAFALSWTTPLELDLSELYQKLRDTYDVSPTTPAELARIGLSRDLVRLTPVGRISTIDGFPNVTSDGGTTSDGGRTRARSARDRRTAVAPAAATAARGPQRPHVPDDVFARARAFFKRTPFTGAFGAAGPHAFMQPYAGSNNWAISRDHTLDGSVMLASDQHLQLPNPSIFYPIHLTVENDAFVEGSINISSRIDVLGVTFPGIPGVILGSNGNAAWAATVSEHDVNDVYDESLVLCEGQPVGDTPRCAQFGAAKVPLETFTEEINIGALGTITQTKTATYEVVPHHGPIIPTIHPTEHRLEPRTGNRALSVRYTGYQPTFEIRAIYELMRANTVDEAFRALRSFGYGSQNWTIIDTQLNIGWSTHAIVPQRAKAAHTWNASTNPGGLAPFLVLPGDGTAEWEGTLSSRYIPHAINPGDGVVARDIVTANADPVGATFDGDPLNQPLVDDRPLYVGVTYAAGLRHERIANMIEDATTNGRAISIEDMQEMQVDTRSTMGAKLTPHLRDALRRLDGAQGAQPDVVDYVATLGADDRARLERARTLLEAWTYETPTGLDDPSTLTDSAATAVFNAWMHFFVERTLGDELDHAGFDVWRLDDNLIARIVYAMVALPADFVASPTTGQPVLCDDMATSGADDSCEKQILVAMLDAIKHLESPAGFGTAMLPMWQWGRLHRLQIRPLFPNTALDLPGPGLPGFAKPGDNFAVNRSDQGWDDLDFSQSADGPAQRFLATAQQGGTIQVKWALPGGAIFDSRSPHYRDLLDRYYLSHTYFDAPFLVPDIVFAGETRWLFR